jgi:hypothetical protein
MSRLLSCDAYNIVSCDAPVKGLTKVFSGNILRGMAKKKSPPLEKTITNNIIRFLNTLPRCYARKIHSSRYASGFPDILCVREGVPIFIEVKRPGNTTTKLQDIELERGSSAGAITMVAYSVEDVKKCMM